MALPSLTNILKKKEFFYGLHNAIANNSLSDDHEFQNNLRTLKDNLQTNDDDSMNEELQNIRQSLRDSENLMTKLTCDVTPTSDCVDDGIIEHNWLNIIVSYQDDVQRIFYLLHELGELTIDDTGVICPPQQTDDWMKDSLGLRGQRGLEQCINNLHCMITGRNTATKPILDIYAQIIPQDASREQSVKWYLQAFSNLLDIITVSGTIALMTALNISGDFIKSQSVQMEALEKIEIHQNVFNSVIQHADATYNKSSDLCCDEITSIKPCPCPTLSSVWTPPITGAQLVIQDNSHIGIQFTTLSISQEESPFILPYMSKQSTEQSIYQASDDSSSTYNPEVIKVNRVDDRWLRVIDHTKECICNGVIHATDVSVKMSIAIADRYDPQRPIYWHENEGDHIQGQNPPLISTGQRKNTSLFRIDTGEVISKFLGWVTGIRLYSKTITDSKETALAIELETLYDI